jgi:hypothetical protein
MINFIYVYRIGDCKEVMYISLQSFFVSPLFGYFHSILFIYL